jgi:hypothetical protein
MLRLLIVASLLVVSQAQAKPPEDADPAQAPWFQGLRQPGTGISCCSIADCRPADWRINNDRYEAFIGGAWRVVPPDKVLHRDDNPTGRAVVCWTPATGVMCFIKGPDI